MPTPDGLESKSAISFTKCEMKLRLSCESSAALETGLFISSSSVLHHPFNLLIKAVK